MVHLSKTPASQTEPRALPVRILRGMRALLPLLALVSLMACLAGCQSDDAPLISPIPANALAGAARGAGGPSNPITEDDRGTRLDRLLAVVEGKPLTLRMMVRRLGIDPAEVDDPDNQHEIERETRSWAKEQLYEKAAERIGLKLQAAKVDAFVEQRITQMVEEASEELGQPVTREEYLRTEGVSWAEFREHQRGLLVRRLYIQKLLTGIGSGTRPQVDLTVTPAEVRRIYGSHRELFDEQAGARLAQFRIPFDKYEDGKRDFLEVEELATGAARSLAADFKRGMAPADIGAKYDLGEEGERWAAARKDQFVSKAPDPQITSWILDPARKTGDHRMLPLPTGIQILGVLETRPARRVPFDEAYAKIVSELTFARTAQLEASSLIDLLSKGRVVWPEELADSLVIEARQVLAKIQELDHLRGARLK